MTKKNLPAHKHNCNECVFLGNAYHPGKFSTEKPCDLYYCDQDGLPTIVVRYGPGTNILIHNAHQRTNIPEINKGLQLARVLGMLD